MKEQVKLHTRYSPLSQSWLILYGDPSDIASEMSHFGIGPDNRRIFLSLSEMEDYLRPMGLMLGQQDYDFAEIVSSHSKLEGDTQ